MTSRGLVQVLLLALALSFGILAQEGVSRKCPTENSELFALNQGSLWNLEMLVKMCHRETDGIFRASGIPKRQLYFYALERDFAEEEFTGSSVAVPLDESAQRGIWRVFRAMVARRLREGAPSRFKGEPSVVNFVAAALTNRVVYCGVGALGTYQRDFRMFRPQFAKRRFPPLEAFLSGRPPASDGILFRVYLTHCNLLLDILEGTTRNLPALLETWAQGEDQGGLSPVQALEKALPPGSLQNGETVQTWYERNALALANENVRDDSPEALRQRLEELLTVSFLSADSQDGITRVHLERLPEMSKDYRLDVAALAEVQKGLMRFKTSVPLLMQDSIGKYVAAVDALRQGIVRDFRERLLEGRQEFAKAASLQGRATEMLDDAEAEGERSGHLRDWLEALKRLEAMEEIDGLIFQ